MATAMTIAQTRIRIKGFKMSRHHIKINDNTPNLIKVSTIFSNLYEPEFVFWDSIINKFSYIL